MTERDRPPTRCWRASRSRTARGCASTSAPRRASARPTRCCRRRTPCARAGSTSSSGSSRPTAGADTEAQIKDLEIVPRRPVDYRGVDARGDGRRRHPPPASPQVVRRRRAGAHQRARAAGTTKRYEDVLELLDAGIHVMTAVNIQHLETLNDAVARATGVRVRETVPDTFLDRADEVINVDVTVEELRNRLREGKIYQPEKVEQALDELLPQGQPLDAARAGAARGRRRGRREGGELPRARRARAGADSRARDGLHELERAGAARHPHRARASPAGSARSGTRSTSRRRASSRAASARATPTRCSRTSGWPRASAPRSSGSRPSKPADGLIAFAQREGVTHVIFGQSARSRWELLWRGSTLDRFLAAVPDAAVQVVPLVD